jgi:hypothetical protein
VAVKNCQLSLHVIPNASRSEIVRWEENTLRVRVAVVPEKGKANAAIMALLASVLDLPKSRISFVRGETSKEKVLRIEGMSIEEVKEKLHIHISKAK